MPVPIGGSRWEVTRGFRTVAGVAYEKGSVLTLRYATDESPYGISSNICNFNVACEHFPEGTVWSGIWKMIEAGQIRELNDAG